MRKVGTETHVKITIPIKPHLLKFIKEFYPQTPYVLSQDDSLGLFLFQLLRRRLFRNRKYYSLEQATENFEVKLSKRYGFKDGCLLLNDYQSHLFNSYIHKKLMDHSITHINAAMDNDSKKKEAIYSFINKYDLDTGRGSANWYDCLKQYHHRWKVKKARISA